jgi:hypothetical protein
MYNLEAATFTVLGNFITSCYTKNWAWQDLLRRPIYYKGSLQKGKFLVFTLPNWFPYNDSILLTGQGGIESKLKDLFLPTQVQKQGDNQQLLILNIEGLTSLIALHRDFELVYWPGYRFVVEPMTYSKEVSPAHYFLKAFDYMLRIRGQSVDLDLTQQSLRVSNFVLKVDGGQTLNSIHISGLEGTSVWDLAKKTILLRGSPFGMFLSALRDMNDSTVRLKNCSIVITDDSVELKYVG